ETSWKEDLEYTTSFEAAGQVNWHVVHSTNKAVYYMFVFSFPYHLTCFACTNTLGDFNLSVHEAPPTCGAGADETQLGTQIDFIIGWINTKLHHGASRQNLGSGQAEDYEGALSMVLSCATAITSAPDLVLSSQIASTHACRDVDSNYANLTEDLNISTAEISDSIAPIKLQFDYYLTEGCQSLPEHWNVCELILLPKPHKPLRSPAHLRPICLLSLQAKLLASVVAGRLQPYVSKYLENLPQYAYVAHRTLAQALERVIGHCAEVRRLVQQQASTLHSRRQGSTSLSLYGGCQLSLDITSAYDHVPRSALRLALQDAGTPDNLIQAILLIHEQARIKIKHADQETLISLHRGLRQGCGLAPILWALYSGWVLKQMNDPTQLSVTDTATVYADDQHFAWTIRHRLGIAKGTFTRAVYGQHFFMGSMLQVFRNLNFRDSETLCSGDIYKTACHNAACIDDIKKSNISLTSPCPYCGLQFTRRARRCPPDASFRIMFGTFQSECPVQTELQAATQDLDMLKSLLPTALNLQQFQYHQSMEIEEQEADQRPQKWQKPGPKGAPQGGKGRRHNPQGSRYNNSWRNNDWGGHRQQDQETWAPRSSRATAQDADQHKQMAELKAIVSMLSTLVLRQEVQMNVSRQDTAYVIFIQTHNSDSLAMSLFRIGEQWRQTKIEKPEQLNAPMRVVMFQHFISTVRDRFTQMTTSPSAKSKARELGYMLEKDDRIPGLRWDHTEKKHVLDDKATTLSTEEVMQDLNQLLVLSSKTLVISRFHGMRKLSEEYTSPTLGMFLEIGMRTQEAQEAWSILHRLSGSATWMAASCYLRHERLQMSALAKRLATVTK
ncbi:unnamed protein product, partial [Symbiodinium necroappetens]